MSINLANEVAKREPPRDRYGRYLLRLPGDNKPRGRTRVTTFIKSLDQGDGLIAWKATANMVGALRTPGLHAKWAALFAETSDPWYYSEETKAQCKKLVEECADHGGASSRADLGTALHSMLERVARGEKVNLVDPYRADVEAWIATLAATGITPDPAWCEVVVYIERYDLVGTFDGLVRQAGRDLAIISDNKTETSTDYKALNHAAQLAAYSLADCAIQFPDNDNEVAELVELPERDLDTGLIIHLPAGEARCALHAVDLEQGRQALEVAAAIRRLDAKRKRKDTGGLMRTWDLVPPSHASAEDEATHNATLTAENGFDGATQREQRPDAPIVRDYKARLLIDRRADLTRNLKARPELVETFNARRLAAKLPRISEAGDFDILKLGYMLAALVAPPSTVTQPDDPFEGISEPAAPVLDEGNPVDDADLKVLADKLRALQGEQAAFYVQVGQQATDSGRPIAMNIVRSTRRYEIGRAVLRCARLISDGGHRVKAKRQAAIDDCYETIRDLIGIVIGSPVQPAIPLGVAFTALSIAEAHRLAEIADGLLDDSLRMQHDDDGHVAAVIAA